MRIGGFEGNQRGEGPVNISRRFFGVDLRGARLSCRESSSANQNLEF